jgi:uncharacterized protein
MGKKYTLVLYLIIIIKILLFQPLNAAPLPVKMSIFNFQPLNIDSSTLSTTVTNTLTASLTTDANISILDRKTLEEFLSLNEMQQNDKLDNVANIGSRLGLDAIVIGTVEKKGTVLAINCKVINIEQKKVIFSQQVRSLGDARMGEDINDLAKAVKKSVMNMSSQVKEEAAFKGPVNVQKRPGNKRIQLNWENAANTTAAAYEIFRSTNENGPFAKIGQVARPEFVDQNLENKVVYYYKIRAYNEKGLPSEYSNIVSAETALTPNSPVLLKADSHIKSVLLTWTPSPISSDDPLKLKGYKLYRSNAEQGPYKEVANVLGTDLNIGVDTASTLDKLFKVNFTDKGLSDGETYYYRLTAYNERNLESEFSSPIKGLTIGTVSDVSAQGDIIREARLSWAPLASPEIKGYYVYRSEKEDTGFTKIKKIDQVSSSEKKITYKDTEGMADLTRYYYRITAFESADLETLPSVTVLAQTKGKPPAPQDVKALAGLVKKIELTWNAATAEEVEGYKIYSSRSTGGEFVLIKKLEGRNTIKYVDEGRDYSKLEDNGTYYYRITSYNKVDVDSVSVLVSAATKPRPSVPKSLKGEALKVKEIPLSWQANPESDIAYYHVFRSDAVSREFDRIAKVNGKTDYLDKDLKDGVTYRYKLQAEDRSGLLSDFSEITSIQTKPRPKIPSGLSGEIRGGKVNLKWERNPEPDIGSYTVYEKKFFGNEKIMSTSDATFSEQAPAKGKSKTYVVTANDKDGLESEAGREITLTAK